ncbi:MAG: hypothetical protein M3Y59_16505 [Myxococcota bacterium]|nr:hypothetical protein [Myxococcota bacterium]
MPSPAPQSPSPELSSLLAQDTLLLFGYAPTGLGHIRVTDALWRGLELPGEPKVIGASDKSLAAAHRLLTQRKAVQAFFEWGQVGWRQQVFTPFYRRSMRGNSTVVQAEVKEAIQKQPVPPRQIVVLATHYDVAHRLAAAKEKLRQETGVPIFLVVQVTDDSPQHVWLVPGADVIFVPSFDTRDTLLAYAKQSGITPPPFVVLSYPIPSELSFPLSDSERASRTASLAPEGDASIRVSVPISGAAAGLLFLGPLMDSLNKKSSRYTFDVICRVAAYTRDFLDRRAAAGNTLHTGTRNHEVIEAYRRLYDTQVISLELTKPSEQAFKTLVGAAARGGSIILFAPPVGRQEKDNLDFLTRHRLLPDRAQTHQLHQLWIVDKPLSEADEALRTAARGWRALVLPHVGQIAAGFAHWALRSGLLAAMDQCDHPLPRETAHAEVELAPDGVSQFWAEVARRAADARSTGA